MKVAISNLAWSPAEEPIVASVISEHGIAGIEVAPTKIWPDPTSVSPADALAYRTGWERRGVRIVAMQALLFGREDLKLFADAPVRATTIAYLKRVIELGARLGVRALVFGSPRNRQIGRLSVDEAQPIAVAAFREIGDAAEAAGVSFCIEPNPAAYECDYLNTVADTVTLLEAVDSPGLGLHLDAGSMTLNAEPIGETVAHARRWIRHYHISEPYLAPPGSSGVQHGRIAEALRHIDYAGWCSIEMKATSAPARVRIDEALRYAAEAYGAA